MHDSVAEVVGQYDADTLEALGKDGAPIRIEDLPILISALEKEMKALAKSMEFERAAEVRDEIKRLRSLMGTGAGGGHRTARRHRPGARGR